MSQQRVRYRSRIWATLKALFRARITAGLAVVLPIWLTILLVRFVFELMRDASAWVVEAFLRSPWGAPILLRWSVRLEELTQRLGHAPSPSEVYAYLPQHVQWGISIFSVLLTVFTLYVIGLFAANLVGRRVIELGERLLDRVPLVKTVYRATKQIMTSFTGDQAANFQRVAILPFMTPGIRSIGFITNIVRDANTGQELCTVFCPTTPNPTSGFILILPRADLIELDWSVDDAVRAIISGGLVLPGPISFVPRRSAFVPEADSGPPAPPSLVDLHK